MADAGQSPSVSGAPDRLRHLVDVILASLDDSLGDEVDGAELAARAFLSRFHFDRLVAAGLGEPPAAFRRRLLLERAAWQISRGTNVTDAGIAAGYGSTEGFSRAFSATFGRPPSHFRRAPGDFRLPARNGIHFHPRGGLAFPGAGPGDSGAMGLTDRLLEHDHWLTSQLLERAGRLSDSQLDQEVRPGHIVLDFDGPEPTVRVMLDRLVWTKEVWTAAMRGRPLPEAVATDLAALRRRWAVAGAAFLDVAREVRDRGEWDASFVDALCDPPQMFTFGGVIAHVVTFSAHRRQVLIGALAEFGVDDLPPGCPIEWERQRAAERPHPAPVLRGTPSSAEEQRP
jgi:AraC family transcriptional regulator